jgi:HD-GYP domain-containing protein (c-di-GMP phosphodiesterase class II)
LSRWHHELLDSSGYPDGLRGDAIPLLSQIIGIVDVFDALTTSRPYRAALPSSRPARTWCAM